MEYQLKRLQLLILDEMLQDKVIKYKDTQFINGVLYAVVHSYINAKSTWSNYDHIVIPSSTDMVYHKLSSVDLEATPMTIPELRKAYKNKLQAHLDKA